MFSRAIRSVYYALKSLMLHKLRTCLAMLGILIGVTAVIWLVALGEGVSYQAQQQIKELGATNIILKSAKPSSTSSQGRSFVVEYGLTRADYDRILDGVPTIQRAVPMREIKGSTLRVDTRTVDAQVIGCTPAYQDINALKTSRGRFLSDNDIQENRNVVVLASETAERLFGYHNPLGKTIEVVANSRADVYVVIGVTQERMPSASIGSSLEGRSYNLDSYIPISTLRARIGDQIITAKSGSREGELVELSQITLSVGDIDEVEEASQIIEILMKKYHPNVDYSITVPKELLKQAETLRMMFNALLVVIAGISLFVGGIGIMNIMLATVTERTREIGVRRSLGANRKDIIVQFLAETVVLAGLGGLLGVGVGFLCPLATEWTLSLIKEFMPTVWTSIPPTV
ncbi:MAG: ABC transporter permease, partial [Planctomycetota bacterium]|nr:ABC transporter permease [Planctomycetota bacterium]